jgi:hypothetical protein
MKHVFLILATAVSLSACGHAVAGTATKPMVPTTTHQSTDQFVADLEQITGEDTDPLTAVAEAEKVCRQMVYLHTREDVITYLGAYHMANRGSATPRSTGQLIATLLMYSCPATGINVVALLQ